jgi:hypothetical protein
MPFVCYWTTNKPIEERMAVKTRRLWSDADLRELKAMARKHTNARLIAKKLKRTEGATRQKACSMSLSLESRAA